MSTKKLIKKNSFDSAFAAARKLGLKTFKWTNPKTGKTNVYTTQISGEEYRPQTFYASNLAVPKEILDKHPRLQQTVNQRDAEQRITALAQLQIPRENFVIDGNNVAYRNFNNGATVLPEVVVNAPYKFAAHLKDGVLESNPGFVPVTYRGEDGGEFEGEIIPNIFQKMGTNQYYITNPNGIIQETSNDPRILSVNPEIRKKGIKARYDYQRKDTAETEALAAAGDEAALNRIDQAVQNGYNPETGLYTTKNLGENIAVRRNNFARGINATGYGFGHATFGLARTALNDDYTLKDYAEGFLDSPHKSTFGLGDVVEAENPTTNYILNTVVNPFSLMSLAGSTGSTYNTKQFTGPKGSTIRYQQGVTGTFKPGKGHNAGKPFTKGYGNVHGGKYHFRGKQLVQIPSQVVPITNMGSTQLQMTTTGLAKIPGNIQYNTVPRIMFDDRQLERPEYTWKPNTEEAVTPGILWSEQNSTYDVIPNENNTSGGNYKWVAPGGRTIITLPSTGSTGERQTTGKPFE